MIQAYSVPFMLAELVLAGEIAGDAKAYLQEGIEKSVYHVNSVSVASNATVPTIGGETLTTFLENIMKKLSRWYDVQVTFKDEAAKQYHFEGSVPKYSSIKEICNIIELTTHVRFELEKNNIIVKLK